MIHLTKKKGEGRVSEGRKKKIEYIEVKKCTKGNPKARQLGKRVLDCVYPDWKKVNKKRTARDEFQGLPLMKFLIEDVGGDTEIFAFPGGFISHIAPGDRIEERVGKLSKEVPMLVCGLDRHGTDIATPHIFIEGKQRMRIRQCSVSYTDKTKPEYLKDERTLEHDGLLFAILSCGEIFSRDLREIVVSKSPDVAIDLAHFSCSRLHNWIRRIGEIAPDGCGFLTQHLSNPITDTKYHTGNARHIGTIKYILSQDDGAFSVQKVSVRRFLI